MNECMNEKKKKTKMENQKKLENGNNKTKKTTTYRMTSSFITIGLLLSWYTNQLELDETL